MRRIRWRHAPRLGAAPQILVEPQDGSFPPDGAYVLSVTAVGDSPLSFHWYFNGNVSVITNASTFATNGAGTYVVVVVNDSGSATSRAATVTAA